MLKVCELIHMKDGLLLIDYLNSHSARVQPFPSPAILDINMPRINGIKALQLIKSSMVYSAIPVIMHSTNGDDKIKEQCLKLEACGVSSKGNYINEIALFAANVLFFLQTLKYKPLGRFVCK